ncbi:hypothetical protein BJP41_07450 [Candidatus Williamhamiltonella defendens]|uniref:Uncharacterized protein n=1 Tax=Candidatus Williamhamiltonella defendens TaxID=138072 RepID=A0A2D3T308_9ENTR|nr:hypothetical protein [Candidatus Hamiltonella defensa]ASV33001.1 hypothetical protein CJJ18_01415 [Candidatus Hamiltonella defensa]ATW30177.1 hypothetical protein BJP41_07450 [Candidatus Hamiltonella defensa]ATW32187.1 hypothetical protein BJP42_07740 [Candidatus Hamiltonella defensa]AWK15952.1 hypothetical protein CCS40_01400 [Candidatus Hamiltonella defensa]MBK4361924.1 hypothetical protein [Candidatus Hamiltonella defensa]
MKLFFAYRNEMLQKILEHSELDNNSVSLKNIQEELENEIDKEIKGHHEHLQYSKLYSMLYKIIKNKNTLKYGTEILDNSDPTLKYNIQVVKNAVLAKLEKMENNKTKNNSKQNFFTKNKTSLTKEQIANMKKIIQEDGIDLSSILSGKTLEVVKQNLNQELQLFSKKYYSIPEDGKKISSKIFIERNKKDAKFELHNLYLLKPQLLKMLSAINSENSENV